MRASHAFREAKRRVRAVRDGSAAILRKLGLRKDEGLVAQARLAQVRL